MFVLQILANMFVLQIIKLQILAIFLFGMISCSDTDRNGIVHHNNTPLKAIHNTRYSGQTEYTKEPRTSSNLGLLAI